MKTAISIPDALFAEAEETAAELNMSRSGLFAEALREFLEKRSSARLTKKVNEVLAAAGEESVEPLELAFAEVLPDEKW